jgi:hypothetical protein
MSNVALNSMNLRESIGLALLVIGVALVPVGWIVSHEMLVSAAIALALGGWLFYTPRIQKREAKLAKEGGPASGGPAMPNDINNSTGWRTGGRTETIESASDGGDVDGD